MLRVLTLFDSKQMQQTIHGLFKKLGAKVIPCEKSYSAFLRALQYAPHLIILNFREKSVDEMKLLQLMKKNKNLGDLPIYVIGPKSTAEQREAILNYGASELFSEPLDLRKFLQHINTDLQKKRKEVRKEEGFDVNQLDPADEKILLDPKQILGKKLDILEKHIDKLLAFPSTIAQVLKISDEDTSGAGDLGKVIESDSAVAAEVLKLANSVYFAARDSRITSLKTAIVRIGFNQTKSIVMSMSVMKGINENNYQTGFSHKEFWFHSLAVAVAAEAIAKKTKIIQPDEAFVLGLLHELGVLLYNEYINKVFLLLLDKSTSKGFPFTAFQQDTLRFSHNDLVARLAEKWNFSKEVVQAFKHLDKICLTPACLEESPHAAVILAADVAAHALQIGRSADCCVCPVPLDIMNKIGGTQPMSPQFIEQTFHAMNMYNAIMKIDQREYPLPETEMEGNGEISVIHYRALRRHWIPVDTYLELQGYPLHLCTTLEMLTSWENPTDLPPVVLFPDYSDEDWPALEHCRKEQLRVIVIDPDGLVPDDYEALSEVVTTYPIDLRNLEMVLHAFSMDCFDEVKTGELRQLLPLKSARKKLMYAMVACSLTRQGKGIQNLLLQFGLSYVEVTDDSRKAVNLSATAEDDLDLIMLEHSLQGTINTDDVIAQIRKQPHHKRARFVVLYTASDTLNAAELERYKQLNVSKLLNLSDRDAVKLFFKELLEDRP